MSTQVQLRRGTAAQHANFVGAPGEITYVTDENTIRVHDGVTPGGHEVSDADLRQAFDAHLADGVHGKVEATSTDDATSPVNAPLKSAGGLAVAKRAFFGDVIDTAKGIDTGNYSWRYLLRVGYLAHTNVDWTTILTRTTTVSAWMPVIITIVTYRGTPAETNSITRVMIRPNKTYVVLSQEGDSGTSGYDGVELRWELEDFQIRITNSFTGAGVRAEAFGGNWLTFSSWMGGA